VPRFFFHIFDDTVSMDEEGQDAADASAARAIAMRGARELACEQIRNGYLNLDHYILVSDQDGREVARVRFRGAFAVSEKKKDEI
jgi:hypothetical protein